MLILLFLVTLTGITHAMGSFPPKDPDRDHISHPIKISNRRQQPLISSSASSDSHTGSSDNEEKEEEISTTSNSPRSHEGSPLDASSLKNRFKDLKRAAKIAKGALSPHRNSPPQSSDRETEQPAAQRVTSEQQLSADHINDGPIDDDNDDFPPPLESPTLNDSPRKELNGEMNIEFDSIAQKLAHALYNFCHAEGLAEKECENEYSTIRNQIFEKYPEIAEKIIIRALEIFEQRVTVRVQQERIQERANQLRKMVAASDSKINTSASSLDTHQEHANRA